MEIGKNTYDISTITDIEYLKELETYVNMDIDNIGKDSDIIKNMKTKMIGMSVDEMEKQSLDYLVELKLNIKNRIFELLV